MNDFLQQISITDNNLVSKLTFAFKRFASTFIFTQDFHAYWLVSDKAGFQDIKGQDTTSLESQSEFRMAGL